MNRNRIKLVTVASTTVQSQPHKHGTGGHDSIIGIANFNLGINGAAFSRCDMTTIEAGCDQLVFTGIRRSVSPASCSMTN